MPVITALIVAIAIVVGFAAHLISNNPNSPIEEIAEEIIKVETGIDIEFSPEEKSKTNEANTSVG